MNQYDVLQEFYNIIEACHEAECKKFATQQVDIDYWTCFSPEITQQPNAGNL